MICANFCGLSRAFLKSTMLPFKKILIPVDYSAPCNCVIPYVREMQHRFSASLTLVHAYGAEALSSIQLPLSDPGLIAATQSSEQERLREFAQESFPGVHVECCAELGDPGTVVGNVVRRQGADLVMLATQGSGVVRRFLVGSVAAKVLHDVSCVVWTATRTALAKRAVQLPYKTILCAVDQSEEAPALVTAAAALARCYQGQLRLVHVIEMAATEDIDFAVYEKDMIEGGNHRMRELKGSLQIDVPHTILSGSREDAIREEAIRRKADLIVAGRGHAQSSFGRMWSHLYSMVRESPCPVISI
jgi:nucleotide-binding universal stress UspA family protein